jgi:hypothetical protein
MEETNNEELDIPKDGKIDLKFIMTAIMQKFLGKSLDYARISGMSDRSFNQFQRSLKDDHYTILGHGLKMLEDNGYIAEDSSNETK